ncbi:AzlD domain-containing protein [Sulfitobacter mediterraneus]|uniref:AzlD domain-containing protein n=1 Tax=Sulfitobacter mediterraneus TaxID=83219 RepID=UPI001933723A|nr:AzlD domain-containing protein [Sulfitobacter mediterraneus]MBM1310591.1 AzlD domain-containing protein [Sulfitobacter mediterraneus]MBM1314475.1 AzlD domain-containing protein [Sulfitobacter mediterraneus]MBM1322835.1 AzlD domain-containing protein [Sulfitobacter mediterraneus]MBM1326747.1 AzlD domain-containing protein [Sulfitobacter mediterraneus]MBM1398093.1 AzlD domain-containing protein [Sulfitobacter mediterraneus]
MIDKPTLWIVIIALGIGSFFLRFVFTGLVGSRAMPDWLLRHLRYTAVAILPALVAPQVIWPQATGGETEPARLAAACVTLLVGLLSKNVIAAILSGAFTLYGLLYLLG